MSISMVLKAISPLGGTLMTRKLCPICGELPAGRSGVCRDCGREIRREGRSEMGSAWGGFELEVSSSLLDEEGDTDDEGEANH